MTGHPCTSCGGDYGACVNGPQCCTRCHAEGIRTHLHAVNPIMEPSPGRPSRSDPLAEVEAVLIVAWVACFIAAVGILAVVATR